MIKGLNLFWGNHNNVQILKKKIEVSFDGLFIQPMNQKVGLGGVGLLIHMVGLASQTKISVDLVLKSQVLILGF